MANSTDFSRIGPFMFSLRSDTVKEMVMSEWQPIETAPLDKRVLLWWTPVTENKYAEACVIGQVSSYVPGTWWNGQRGVNEDLARISHWMPLPERPAIPQGER